MGDQKQRTILISVTVDKEEFATIRRNAKRYGHSMSGYLRWRGTTDDNVISVLPPGTERKQA